MKVGDKYKVYIEVAPGQFEPVAEAAIKRFNRDENLVDLVVPATLVTFQTKVELDTSPTEPQPVGNAHVILGTEGPDNSSGVDTQPTIPVPPVTPVEGAQAAPAVATPPTVVNAPPVVGEGSIQPVVEPTPIAHEVVQTPPADPSAPPVES